MAQIQPGSFWEHQLYTTLKLEISAGEFGAVGSGFFYNHPLTGGSVLPLLITNRHNISGAQHIKVRFHQRDTSADRWAVNGHVDIELPLPEEHWHIHPDGSVDLAGVPLAIFQQYAALDNKHLAVQAFGPHLIPPDLAMFDALEDVVMIGYPSGEGDLINNYPLLLRGSTATHPGIDYENRAVIVLNIASFDGPSGSPVIVVNNVNRTKAVPYFSLSPFAFLGVFYHGPMHKVHGEVLSQDAPLEGLTVQAHIPMNVGWAIKAKEVAVLATHIEAALHPRSS